MTERYVMINDDDDDVEETRESSGYSGSSQGRSGQYRRRERDGDSRTRRVRQCAFCVDKVAAVDYKQISTLLPFISIRGKIKPRRQTGLCGKHQRQMACAVKRARHLALLPFTTAGLGRLPRQ